MYCTSMCYRLQCIGVPIDTQLLLFELGRILPDEEGDRSCDNVILLFVQSYAPLSILEWKGLRAVVGEPGMIATLNFQEGRAGLGQLVEEGISIFFGKLLVEYVFGSDNDQGIDGSVVQIHVSRKLIRFANAPHDQFGYAGL